MTPDDTARVIHVVSVSGGKDSTATAILAIQTHGRENCKFINCDTGNEHAETYEYLDYLEGALGIRIERLKADFSRQIANKRMFIARDQRRGRRNGRRIRWTNKAKRRALAALHPTGIPFLDMCMWKGRFPSRGAQFCTQHLKTEMAVRYQLELVDQGYTVVSWQGVRRDESLNRSNVLQIEEAAEGLWQYRPIADWTAQQVFGLHLESGIAPNPLYRQGMGRVGCMPCINARKGEIREIAKRFPEYVREVRRWEDLVGACSKRGFSTFFHKLDATGTPETVFSENNVHKTVEWAMTSRGGRERDLFADEPPAACSSAYGLCG